MLFFFIVLLCILISIKFIHQQTHSLLNMTKFKIYIKNHFGLLLHVSVYDHHQGALISAQLKLHLG